MAERSLGEPAAPAPSVTATPMATIETFSPNGLGPAFPTPAPTATPYRVPADLDHIPVKSIELDFRRVAPSDSLQGIGSGTSDHAFIVITRTDGFKQVLSLDPVPAADAMKGTAQATFIGGNESKHDIAEPGRRFKLNAPNYPGLSHSESLTRYGNELVSGARAYNEHPIRYDVPASEGWNSNSWAASLVVAKGGAAGLADVRHIASEMDGKLPFLRESPGVAPPWQRGDDGRESTNVVNAIDAGATIAPGFHNASIPSDRFESGPVHDHVARYPHPEKDATTNGVAAVAGDRGRAVTSDLSSYIAQNVTNVANSVAHSIFVHRQQTRGRSSRSRRESRGRHSSDSSSRTADSRRTQWKGRRVSRRFLRAGRPYHGDRRRPRDPKHRSRHGGL